MGMAKKIQDPMIVDDLLIDLLSAIAVGHASLVKRSVSPLGTLVVKSAEVSVAFDLSAEARQSDTGFTLGVRPTSPLSFVGETTQTNQTSEMTVSNRATVTLQIVNVPPLLSEPLPPPKPDPKPPDPEPFDPTRALSILEKFLRAHPGFFSDALIAAFNRALAEYKAGNAAGARRLFAPVLAEIGAAMKALPPPVDPAAEEALKQLTVWAGQARREPQKLSSKNRTDLEKLLNMAGDIRLEAELRQAFEAGIRAALNAGSRAEAQARLAGILIVIQPGLTGKLPPPAFFDLLGQLNVLAILKNPDRAWRNKLAKPMEALISLVNSLEIPAKTKNLFARDCQKAAASGSELEAGSRLYQAVQDLKRRTRGIKLPAEVRQVLEGFEPKK
jgi:hypothetical protein